MEGIYQFLLLRLRRYCRNCWLRPWFQLEFGKKGGLIVELVFGKLLTSVEFIKDTGRTGEFISRKEGFLIDDYKCRALYGGDPMMKSMAIVRSEDPSKLITDISKQR